MKMLQNEVNWFSTNTSYAEHQNLQLPKSTPPFAHNNYRKTSNIRRTSVGNKIVDHSDVVGAPPVGAAPTTSSFST